MDKVPPLAMLGTIAEPYDAEVSPDDCRQHLT